MPRGGNKIEVAIAEVVDYLRITGKFAPALSDVVERKLAAQAARESGIEVSTQDLQKVADTFRILNGLSTASDAARWLKSLGLSLRTLEDFLETNLLIARFKDELARKRSDDAPLPSSGSAESDKQIRYQEWLEHALRPQQTAPGKEASP